MRGQFHETAEIRGNGKTLKVTGPVEFEDDERGAVIHVTVVQGSSKVQGDSSFTPSGALRWSATLTGSDGFAPGEANGDASATVHLKDGGTEPYPPWGQEIELVLALV
jgi:hypothetical protein